MKLCSYLSIYELGRSVVHERRIAPETDSLSGSAIELKPGKASCASRSDLLIDPFSEEPVWLRLADRMVV